MESQPWWNKAAEASGVRDMADASSKSDQFDDAKSIGEQIDRAIGEFDARLNRLREQLKENEGEHKRIEKEIAAVEKDQAKAMKELLNTNPRIREMLGQKVKPKPIGRRRKKSADSPAGADTESLL